MYIYNSLHNKTTKIGGIYPQIICRTLYHLAPDISVWTKGEATDNHISIFKAAIVVCLFCKVLPKVSCIFVLLEIVNMECKLSLNYALRCLEKSCIQNQKNVERFWFYFPKKQEIVMVVGIMLQIQNAEEHLRGQSK